MMRCAKRVRSDSVGNICGLIRGWFTSAFAAAPTFSFPGMAQARDPYEENCDSAGVENCEESEDACKYGVRGIRVRNGC